MVSGGVDPRICDNAKNKDACEGFRQWCDNINAQSKPEWMLPTDKGAKFRMDDYEDCYVGAVTYSALGHMPAKPAKGAPKPAVPAGAPDSAGPQKPAPTAVREESGREQAAAVIDALAAQTEKIQMSLFNLEDARLAIGRLLIGNHSQEVARQVSRRLAQGGAAVCDQLDDIFVKLALLVGGRVIERRTGCSEWCHPTGKSLLCLDGVPRSTVDQFYGRFNMMDVCILFRMGAAANDADLERVLKDREKSQ